MLYLAITINSETSSATLRIGAEKEPMFQFSADAKRVTIAAHPEIPGTAAGVAEIVKAVQNWTQYATAALMAQLVEVDPVSLRPVKMTSTLTVSVVTDPDGATHKIIASEGVTILDLATAADGTVTLAALDNEVGLSWLDFARALIVAA